MKLSDKILEVYNIEERKDPKRCENCQADYSFCQLIKCCTFQGLEKDIKFIKVNNDN